MRRAPAPRLGARQPASGAPEMAPRWRTEHYDASDPHASGGGRTDSAGTPLDRSDGGDTPSESTADGDVGTSRCACRCTVPAGANPACETRRWVGGAVRRGVELCVRRGWAWRGGVADQSEGGIGWGRGGGLCSCSGFCRFRWSGWLGGARAGAAADDAQAAGVGWGWDQGWDGSACSSTGSASAASAASAAASAAATASAAAAATARASAAAAAAFAAAAAASTAAAATAAAAAACAAEWWGAGCVCSAGGEWDLLRGERDAGWAGGPATSAARSVRGGGWADVSWAIR